MTAVPPNVYIVHPGDGQGAVNGADRVAGRVGDFHSRRGIRLGQEPVPTYFHIRVLRYPTLKGSRGALDDRGIGERLCYDCSH